ncbi:MAG: alpha/beta hydrolase [Bacteroidia bacterium]
MKFFLLPLFLVIFLFPCCSFKRVSKTKDVVYSPSKNLLLDVYAPRKIKEPKKILVYLYGGNWRSGKKELYKFFGKGMARKGLICVVLNYRLNPTLIEDMAGDVAEAVKWAKENAASFKGDTNNIYISGHSAGGHLAAMVATDNSYFEKLNMRNPIQGVILIDAFGLDMYKYLTVSNSPKDTIYTKVFSNNPAQWKKLSPINYLSKQTPPFLVLTGGKTYPAITQLNDIFYSELKKYQPNAPFILYKRRKHIPMIGQFYFTCAKGYKDVLGFIGEH